NIQATITLNFFLFQLQRLHPTLTLFPYTTLFRSFKWGATGLCPLGDGYFYISHNGKSEDGQQQTTIYKYKWVGDAETPFVRVKRSEEHTSELQSRENLVCRLLLEKKKRNNTQKNQ